MVRHYLRWKPGLMEWEDLQLRFALREALAAPELVDRAPGKFREGLDRFEVRAVVLASSGRAGTARTILGQAGFHRTNHADGYELWIRSEVGVTSPASTTRGAPVPLRSTGGVPVIRALAGNLR
jgi:rhodanese-related sulfurtransferase